MTKTTKETLITEYINFKLGEDTNVDKSLNKYEKFITRNSKNPDSELTLILQSLRTLKADNEMQSFADCCKLASPIFNHLEATTNWGYIDLYVLSTTIGYKIDFNKALEVLQEAIDVIEGEYSDDPKFQPICTMMHMNFTLRMLRAKYFEPHIDTKILDDAFDRSFDHGMKVCENRNLPHKYVLHIRRGVFEGDINLVERALAQLSKSGGRKRYRTTKDEIAEYLFHTEEALSKPLSNFLIGYQLRKRRKELNMSTFDIAVAMKTDQPSITAIERGDDGVSMERLKMLARVVGVRPGYFFGNDNDKIEDVDAFFLTVKAHMSGATDMEKDYLLDYMNMMMHYKHLVRDKKE